MALNLETDHMGVVVIGDVRAITGVDSVMFAVAPVITLRQSVCEPMTKGFKASTARASVVTCQSVALPECQQTSSPRRHVLCPCVLKKKEEALHLDRRALRMAQD